MTTLVGDPQQAAGDKLCFKLTGIKMRYSKTRLHGKCALTAAMLVSASWSLPLLAQTETPAAEASPLPSQVNLEARTEGGKQIYEAAAFGRFAPQTALDMVQQIPGFSISQVSSDRGLGEASQNVLINGQRITGKSNDAQTALGRIPVSSVVRLEIADGATLNVSGINGQVLNVVTKADKLQGNFAWRGRLRPRIKPYFTGGEVSISGKLGKGDFTLGINNNDSFRAGGYGPDISRDASGNLLVTRELFNYADQDSPKITGTYSRTSAGGSIFNANAAFGIQRFKRRADYDVFVPGELPSTELSSGSERGWNFEGGADYEFALGGGRLKLVGFHRMENSPSKDLFRSDFTNGNPSTGERFDQVVDDGESVLRGEYRWKSGKSDWQVSLEGAYNYFDAESELFELAGDDFVPIIFNGATSRVEEKRVQSILTYGRPLSNNLTLQATLGGEYSQLSQSGERGLTRSFIRPKGSLALNWKASSALTVSSKLQRKVGQLSFGSFLASVDLQNDNDNASNPELVPSQSWLLENEANWSLGKAGSVKFKLDGELISDLVDQIAISPTQEAVGNLSSIAKRLRGEINGSFVLDTIGFNGAKLDLVLAYQKTRVRDALQISRPLSDRGLSFWSVEFRHDIPGSKLAWGFAGEKDVATPFYRLDYQSREFNTAITSSAYLEHKDLRGLKIRATVQNLFGQVEKQAEIFYTDRRDGGIAFTRDATFGFGTMFRLNISGTF
jgi:outer membrane receptor for ferrienterochelin and colicins